MAIGDFRWNAFNLEKIAKHGVTRQEAEHVVRFAKRPFPRPHKKGTYYVLGRGSSNRRVQVIYSSGCRWHVLCDPCDAGSVTALKRRSSYASQDEKH
jgi:hypothetical protein